MRFSDVAHADYLRLALTQGVRRGWCAVDNNARACKSEVGPSGEVVHSDGAVLCIAGEDTVVAAQPIRSCIKLPTSALLTRCTRLQAAREGDASYVSCAVHLSTRIGNCARFFPPYTLHPRFIEMARTSLVQCTAMSLSVASLAISSLVRIPLTWFIQRSLKFCRASTPRCSQRFGTLLLATSLRLAER